MTQEIAPIALKESETTISIDFRRLAVLGHHASNLKRCHLLIFTVFQHPNSIYRQHIKLAALGLGRARSRKIVATAFIGHKPIISVNFSLS